MIGVAFRMVSQATNFMQSLNTSLMPMGYQSRSSHVRGFALGRTRAAEYVRISIDYFVQLILR